MGFNAPPATNVIVAPGSAVTKLDRAQIQTSNISLTLYLVCEEYCNLCARIRVTEYESDEMKPTLNSSESLDSLESICEPVRTYTAAAACLDGYLSELSGCQEIVRNWDEERGGIPSVASH